MPFAFAMCSRTLQTRIQAVRCAFLSSPAATISKNGYETNCVVGIFSSFSIAISRPPFSTQSKKAHCQGNAVLCLCIEML